MTSISLQAPEPGATALLQRRAASSKMLAPIAIPGSPSTFEALLKQAAPVDSKASADEPTASFLMAPTPAQPSDEAFPTTELQGASESAIMGSGYEQTEPQVSAAVTQWAATGGPTAPERPAPGDSRPTVLDSTSAEPEMSSGAWSLQPKGQGLTARADVVVDRPIGRDATVAETRSTIAERAINPEIQKGAPTMSPAVRTAQNSVPTERGPSSLPTASSAQAAPVGAAQPSPDDLVRSSPSAPTEESKLPEAPWPDGESHVHEAFHQNPVGGDSQKAAVEQSSLSPTASSFASPFASPFQAPATVDPVEIGRLAGNKPAAAAGAASNAIKLEPSGHLADQPATAPMLGLTTAAPSSMPAPPATDRPARTGSASGASASMPGRTPAGMSRLVDGDTTISAANMNPGIGRSFNLAAHETTTTHPGSLTPSPTPSPAPSLTTPAAEPLTILPPGTAAADRIPEPIPQGYTNERLETPLTHEDFPRILGLKIGQWIEDEVQQVWLDVHPADMGPVAIQIAIDGRQAELNFGVDSAAARDLIQASLPELASALQTAGLTLSGGSISQDRPQARQDGASDEQRGAAGRASRLGQSGAAGLSASPRTSTVAQGLLDIYA